jgi:hypothetical protein
VKQQKVGNNESMSKSLSDDMRTASKALEVSMANIQRRNSSAVVVVTTNEANQPNKIQLRSSSSNKRRSTISESSALNDSFSQPEIQAKITPIIKTSARKSLTQSQISKMVTFAEPPFLSVSFEDSN